MRKGIMIAVMMMCIMLQGIWGNELKGKVDNNPDSYSKRELEAIREAGFDPSKIYVSDIPAPTSEFELGKWKSKYEDYRSDYRYLPNLYYRWNCYFQRQSGDRVDITSEKGGISLSLKMSQDWVNLLQLEDWKYTPIYIEFRGTAGSWEITYMERIDGIVTKHCPTCACF